MDLLLTEDQQQIVDSVRDVLRHEFSFDRLCAHQAPFVDGARSVWPTMAQLGWFAMGLAEDAGGLGLSVAEECLLLREAGRHLVPVGLLASVLAAHAASDCARPELAAAFATGAERPGLLLAQEPLEAGREVPVYLADAAGAAWCVGWTGEALFLVEREALRDSRPASGLDRLVPLEKATLDPVRAPLRTQGALAMHADVLIAAQLTGLAEGSRDMATEYAKVREQFGRPIGSFQAIKHRCADMAVACEVAHCQTVWSALKVRDGGGDARREAAAARMLAQDAAEANAAANIQIHGAMGFTDEGGAHHFLKRAWLLKHAGAPAALRASLLT